MKNNILKKIDNLSFKYSLNFRYIFKNSFWITTENFASLTFGLLVVYAMGNFLDPNTAGQYKYLISLAAIVSSFTIAGVTFAVTRETANGQDSFFQYATSKSLKWSLLPITIAFFLAAYYFFKGNSSYAVAFFLATFFTVMIANFSIYRSYLTGKEDFKQMAVYGNLILIIGSLFSVLTFYFTQNLILLIIGSLGSNFLLWFIMYYQVRRKIPNTDVHPTSIKNFNDYVYSQSFINIISLGATHLDKVILFQLLGPVELAIYTFVTVLPEKIRGLLKSFSSIIFPKFVKREMQTIKDKMLKETLLFFAFLFFCFLGTVAITPFVFEWFLPKYVEYTYLSLIYSLSIFSILAIIPYSAIQAKNLKEKLYTYEILNSTIQIIFVFIGISQFGLLGAVLGKLFASLIGIISLYILLKIK